MLMSVSAEGPPPLASVAAAALTTLPPIAGGGGGSVAPTAAVSNNSKVPPIGAGGGSGPDYSEEGESSPKISSLDPTVATAADAVAATAANSSGSSGAAAGHRDPLQQQRHQSKQHQPRHRTSSGQHKGGGGHPDLTSSSTRPRTSGGGSRGPRPEAPALFPDGLPLSDYLTSSTSEGGGRKRAQRQVNMKKILEGYFCTLTQKFQQPMLSSWVLHRTHIHQGNTNNSGLIGYYYLL
jgi:hypothetical protein